MPSKIRVLDENTINKIAAGEVIENPSSVVKELVENAIDAGSTEITIEIKAGGRQQIRVTDNGCGMSRDDAILCLERHATSKIRNLDDIYSLGSMGFRGEAIPSIASIAKMTILTSEEEGKEGTLVIIDGGSIISCNPAARSKGTTIEVKSLFFNVPVRKKFQRSPAYDAAEILKVVSNQALAHPEIKFQLIHNQTMELSTHSANETLGERIKTVLGSDFKTALKPISLQCGDYQIEGFIGLPSYTRHNRTGQYLFINKRAVFSPFISYAVRDGYGTTLPTTRHPVFVLHVSMPGSLVDVNVHPQKREVRLHKEMSLKEAIIKAIEQALQRHVPAPPVFERSFTPPPLPSRPSYDPPKTVFPFIPPPEPVEAAIPVELPLTAVERVEDPRIPLVVAVLQGYVLLQSDEDRLRLVDQQAAHRRILYEKLQKGPASISVQNLLIPDTLEANPMEAAIIREHLEGLNQLGIGIQEFGQNTFLIQSVPAAWKEMDIPRLIREIADEFNESQASGSADKDQAMRLAKAASKAAVSQRTKLSMQEGQALVRQLFSCSQPNFCPFGNPTIVELSSDDIAKQFERSR